MLLFKSFLCEAISQFSSVSLALSSLFFSLSADIFSKNIFTISSSVVKAILLNKLFMLTLFDSISLFIES